MASLPSDKWDRTERPLFNGAFYPKRNHCSKTRSSTVWAVKVLQRVVMKEAAILVSDLPPHDMVSQLEELVSTSSSHSKQYTPSSTISHRLSSHNDLLWGTIGFVIHDQDQKSSLDRLRNDHCRLDTSVPTAGLDVVQPGINQVYPEHAQCQRRSIRDELAILATEKHAKLVAFEENKRIVNEQRQILRCVIFDSRSLVHLHSKLRCVLSMQEQIFQTVMYKKGPSIPFQVDVREADMCFSDTNADWTADDNGTVQTYIWIRQYLRERKCPMIPGLVTDSLILHLFVVQSMLWLRTTDLAINGIKGRLQDMAKDYLQTRCVDRQMLLSLTDLVNCRIDAKVAAWRTSCHDILRGVQENFQDCSSDHALIDDINTARTTRFLRLRTQLELQGQVLCEDEPARPIFGPLLRPDKMDGVISCPTPPPSIGSSSPKAPSTPRVPKIVFPFAPPWILSELTTAIDPFVPPVSTGFFIDNERTCFAVEKGDKCHIRSIKRLHPRSISTSLSSTSVEAMGKLPCASTLSFLDAQEIITDERQAVYQIHDMLKAYYKFSLKRYTDSICRSLRDDLGQEIVELMDGKLVDDLDEDVVRSLFG